MRLFYCPFCGGATPTAIGFAADGCTLFRCNHPRCRLEFRLKLETPN